MPDVTCDNVTWHSQRCVHLVYIGEWAGGRQVGSGSGEDAGGSEVTRQDLAEDGETQLNI